MTDDTLRAALDVLRNSRRTEPSDGFWSGWDAALAAVEVAIDDPMRYASRAALAASAPDEGPHVDWLDYDGDQRWLIRTERLDDGEYGASEVVARDVAPSFGVWAEAVWNARPAVPVALDVERLAKAIFEVNAVYSANYRATDAQYADLIAREYAALRSEEPTE